MSNTRIYFIYKHNNNKCLLINITIINFYIQTKYKREKKNHIMLNFLVRCKGYQLVDDNFHYILFLAFNKLTSIVNTMFNYSNTKEKLCVYRGMRVSRVLHIP